MKWFSDPQPTKEEAQNLHNPGAQNLHNPGLFDPACVAKTLDNQFVMGLLRTSKQWPPENIQEMEKLINQKWGYTIVSLCEPVFGIWKDWSSPKAKLKNWRT